MSHLASDYQGTYYVKEALNTVAEVEPEVTVEVDLSRGDVITIATKDDDESTAYVTITSDKTGEDLLTDAAFIVSNEFGCLRGDTLPIGAHAMLISRYEEQTSQGKYRSIYGAVIKKDPDSVGAWGADENPP